MSTFRTILSAALVWMTALPAVAQSEAGLLLEAAAEKKISKKLNLEVEADLRTRNDFKTIDRWSVGIGADYKLAKGLKVDAGYKLLNTNFREDISYNANGSYNNWRPSYWGIKHRLYASLSGSYKVNNFKLSLRERWQYTYRPEKTVTRWDFDNEQWEDKVRSSKGKSQLRSRLQIEYDKKKATLTPFANVELYNSMALDKIRYTLGTDIRLNKQHALSVFYRYQNARDNDDDDPDMHYLGVGYKFKF